MNVALLGRRSRARSQDARSAKASDATARRSPGRAVASNHAAARRDRQGVGSCRVAPEGAARRGGVLAGERAAVNATGSTGSGAGGRVRRGHWPASRADDRTRVPDARAASSSPPHRHRAPGRGSENTLGDLSRSCRRSRSPRARAIAEPPTRSTSPRVRPAARTPVKRPPSPPCGRHTRRAPGSRPAPYDAGATAMRAADHVDVGVRDGYRVIDGAGRARRFGRLGAGRAGTHQASAAASEGGARGDRRPRALTRASASSSHPARHRLSFIGLALPQVMPRAGAAARGATRRRGRNGQRQDQRRHRRTLRAALRPSPASRRRPGPASTGRHAHRRGRLLANDCVV